MSRKGPVDGQGMLDFVEDLSLRCCLAMLNHSSMSEWYKKDQDH